MLFFLKVGAAALVDNIMAEIDSLSLNASSSRLRKSIVSSLLSHLVRSPSLLLIK